MRVTRVPLFLTFLALASLPGPVKAQDVSPTVGVVLVAHGASVGWNARVDSLAAAVKRRGVVRGPIATAYLMGPEAAKRPFQRVVDSLARLGASRIVVVPVFASSKSGHADQVRWLAGAIDSLGDVMQHHLHHAGIERPTTRVPMHVTPALDGSPEVATVLVDRVRALVPDPRGRAVLILGHGPETAEDYADWMRALRPVADTLRARLGLASSVVELVRDDAPAPVRAEAVARARELVALQHAATRADVAVVPLLISAGDVSNRKLPADLAGLPVIYDAAPLLPHPALVAWVERRVTEATRGSFTSR